MQGTSAYSKKKKTKTNKLSASGLIEHVHSALFFLLLSHVAFEQSFLTKVSEIAYMLARVHMSVVNSQISKFWIKKSGQHCRADKVCMDIAFILYTAQTK